jgi:hypothetical protein
MPFYAVLEYQADWNSKLNKYQIQIKCQGNPKAFPVAINTEPEYISVLVMLGRPGLEYEPTSGDFRLGPRPAGT